LPFFRVGLENIHIQRLTFAIPLACHPSVQEQLACQVPGVPKDQLQLTITEDAMTLKGEIKEEEKKEGKNYYRRELRYGAFERTIPCR
jgi:HSP20 family protein